MARVGLRSTQVACRIRRRASVLFCKNTPWISTFELLKRNVALFYQRIAHRDADFVKLTRLESQNCTAGSFLQGEGCSPTADSLHSDTGRWLPREKSMTLSCSSRTQLGTDKSARDQNRAILAKKQYPHTSAQNTCDLLIERPLFDGHICNSLPSGKLRRAGIKPYALHQKGNLLSCIFHSSFDWEAHVRMLIQRIQNCFLGSSENDVFELLRLAERFKHLLQCCIFRDVRELQ